MKEGMAVVEVPVCLPASLLPPTTSLLPPKVLGRGVLETVCSRTALAF